MLTTALCFLYLSMRPVPPPDANPANGKQEAPNADPLLRAAEKPATEMGAKAEIDADPAGNPAQPLNYPSQVITLGSMDGTKGFKMVVSVTTRGAGVEHAELVGQKPNGRLAFRALEHDGGYLGYLGLSETLTGMRIRTIPDGSPAQAATSADASGGLQVDDIIEEVNGFSLDSPTAIEPALAKTKPGQTVDVVVSRDVAGTPTQLRYQVVLSEAPLDILRTDSRSSETIPGNRTRPSLRTTLGSLAMTPIPQGKEAIPALQATLEKDWEIDVTSDSAKEFSQQLAAAGGEGVQFRMPLDSLLQGTGRPEKLDLVKRYRLFPAASAENPDGYLLDVETLIINRNDEDVAVSFRQEGLAGLTLEGWWYSVKISPYMFSGAGQRDAMYMSEQDSHQLVTTRQILDEAAKNPERPNKILFSENEPVEARNLSYIGLDSQYFNASIVAHPDSPQSLADLRRAGTVAICDPANIAKSQAQATNTSFWIDTSEKLLPAASQLSQRYHIYIGPKDTELLANHGLDRAIEYGWFPWIAKPLSAILHFFHMIVRNYGLAIVMLTVVVRGCMFPLSRKAAMNAQRMQELQPELKRINDLYKDNMEKRAKAMQELYAKHNFKPLAGCLPMFIQLPIFIGLYRCLSIDISLRQEPLIPGLSWCSNLAGPDMLFDWSTWMPEFIAGRGVGWLGPYFNILPMVTVGLFLLQQKMLMPKATDEQTRMTQNMMQVMTIFMGVLFFKVPSGLCIYFITSSLWSLVERKLVKRFTPPTPPSSLTAAADGPSLDSPKSSGKKRDRFAPVEEKPKGRLQELREMLEKPAVKSSTQRGSSKPPKPSRKNRKR